MGRYLDIFVGRVYFLRFCVFDRHNRGDHTRVAMLGMAEYQQNDAPFKNPNMSTFFWGTTRAPNMSASKEPKKTDASCEEIYKELSDDEVKTFQYLASTNMQ